MTAPTDLIWQSKKPATANWQQQLKTLVREPAQLFALLGLQAEDMPAHLAACQDFSLRVPTAFVDKMQPGDWNDPLLLQVLPQGAELLAQPGFIADPLQEQSNNPHPGLIHKYHGRVLLVVSGGCAINCRYCFRRHFPYEDNNPSRKEWQTALDYIAADSSISEVILSGGDPLVASDKQLAELIANIAAIPHVQTLRVHSRLPLVIPERISDEFVTLLTSSRLQTVFVIHCNHANELDSRVQQAMAKLKAAGVTLLNQSVLLAKVNDNSAALQALNEKLFAMGVLPYYLHVLDKVQGAAHFDVDESHAIALIESLRTKLPGYLVPKLVRELPQQASKTPIPAY
ncbi:EF-P beta-lysylation protein EpmB [Dasania marina]|uniref:EF-P beta-lysylation protein EpmB n=1 Tax=Dasania marina TaxID=471499 RepID=UPI0030D9D944|tara:strand:+ start:8241 stop:9269 length:1029 start_codon:yes stop_codon:yes gene_type:complete